MSPDLVAGLEAILFASDTPVELARLAEVLEAPPEEVRLALETLRAACDGPDRGLTVVEVGGGYRLVTRPEQAAALLRLQRLRLRSRLSRAALETLAIVAYRQPISRPEIEQLRGVSAESVVTHLLERRLVRMVGRKATPGRPILYGTSREFLEHFGLRDLGELPAIEVPAAAAAALARAGLAAEAGAEPGAGPTAPAAEEDGHPAGA